MLKNANLSERERLYKEDVTRFCIALALAVNEEM
jgi:hypothetical protein